MDPIWLSKNAIGVESNSSNTTLIELPTLEALSSRWQVILIVLYSITAFISLSSNVITIVVLVKGERLSSELWKFLFNLSISDILMATFSIPFTYTVFMLGRWIFPKCLCPFVNFAQLCSIFVSVYTLIAIGIDRYFAIVYPLHSLIYIRTHKLHVICLIWIVGVGIASTQLVKTRAVEFPYGNDTYYDCRELWNDEEGKNYTIFIFVVTFALPITALIYVYTSVGWHILLHSTPGNPNQVRDVAQWNIKVKVIKMLAMIVILFALCWFPIQIFNIVVWFYTPKLRTYNQYMIYVVSYFACHWLSMAHSFINPFIYCFMSENFKASLKKFIPKLWRRRVPGYDAELDMYSDSHNTQELSGIKKGYPLVKWKGNVSNGNNGVVSFIFYIDKNE